MTATDIHALYSPLWDKVPECGLAAVVALLKNLLSSACPKCTTKSSVAHRTVPMNRRGFFGVVA